MIGAGYSATNVLIDLVRLARDNSRASVTWVVRGISLMRVLVRSHAECAAWYRDQAAVTRRRTQCMVGGAVRSGRGTHADPPGADRSADCLGPAFLLERRLILVVAQTEYEVVDALLLCRIGNLLPYPIWLRVVGSAGSRQRPPSLSSARACSVEASHRCTSASGYRVICIGHSRLCPPSACIHRAGFLSPSQKSRVAYSPTPIPECRERRRSAIAPAPGSARERGDQDR